MVTAEELLEEISLDKQIDTPVEEPQADEQDPAKLKQRKPPKDGPCKRCGQDKPLNRLMLCYPCWVKAQLEKSGWREGEPHPAWCECTGVPGHTRKSDGN